MLRAILTNGDIRCDDFKHGEHGIDLFTEDGELVAFTPYANLVAIVDEDVVEFDEDEASSIA